MNEPMKAQAALVPGHWMEEARFHTWESWVSLLGMHVLAIRCQAPREGMELGDTGITVESPSPKCFLYLAQVLEFKSF